MVVPQVNCIKCIRSNHPNAEELLSDKQREWKLGQLGKKNETITGTFTDVKRKGQAEKEKQSAGNVRSAEKPFLRMHVRRRQGKKFVCYSVGRESSQERTQSKMFNVFPLSLQKAGLLRQLTRVAKPWESG